MLHTDWFAPRRSRAMTALLAVVVLCAAVVGVLHSRPAGASASAHPQFLGWAGGTQVVAAGGAVQSNLTAASSVSTGTVGAHSANAVARADVAAGLISVGAVQSAVSTSKITGGVGLSTSVRTSGVGALGGLVHIDAVTTTAHARSVGDHGSATAATTFAGVSISGVTVPVHIPRNYAVTIPGVATILFNGSYSSTKGDGSVRVDASALYITLLAARDGSAAGTVIYLNPTHAEIGEATPTDLPAPHGVAFGTEITVHGGGLLDADSGPTAYNAIPDGGTGGRTVTNSTAAVALPKIATAGVVQTSVTGTMTRAQSSGEASATIGATDLLAGLVRLDAITAHAAVVKLPGSAPVVSVSSTITGLRVAGTPVAITGKPNRTLVVPGVARIVINEQVRSAAQGGVTALHITLLEPRGSAPAGAEILVGVAGVWLTNF